MSLVAHLASGVTTVCRCWAIVRGDGVTFGFTDHDRPLAFEGIDFRADTGLTAGALAQGTGLAVDNGEAMGILSDAVISEGDIDAGRFDGASVRAWLVNWADPRDRLLQFNGTIGEIRRGAGAFHAELRGLTDRLNQPMGRVYQRTCAAVLGDATCRVDLGAAGRTLDVAVEAVAGGQRLSFATLAAHPGWFERGTLRVLTGAAAGLTGIVKSDAGTGPRTLTLWEPLRAAVATGDVVRLVAGCDKRLSTCRDRFDNTLNFQGFPHIPGEDWLVSIPRDSGENDGGSLFR